MLSSMIPIATKTVPGKFEAVLKNLNQMKKLFVYALSLAAVLSCQKTDPEASSVTPTPDPVPGEYISENDIAAGLELMEIGADIDGGSSEDKTTLSGTSVLWESTDMLSTFWTTTSGENCHTCFQYYSGSGSKSGKFKGPGTRSQDYWYA